MIFSGISLLSWGRKMGEKYQNVSPSPGAAPAAQPPNYKTCVISVTLSWGCPGSPTPNYKTCIISANYEPISTKFSGISVPTSWQGMDEKYVEKCHPLFGLPHPHIFKYCQLLDITDNNERISMKFSGISLLARRRKRVKKYQNLSPPPGAAPAAPAFNSKTHIISANYEPISTSTAYLLFNSVHWLPL